MHCVLRVRQLTSRGKFVHNFQPTRQISSTLSRRVEKPYLVTTPIFYVNAEPHIGHLYTGVLADILARYSRIRNPSTPVIFCTGTDEHGFKIQKAAQLNGVSPRDLCDRISGRFRDLATSANLSHTRFIRTTDPDHKVAAQHFWTELQTRGYIYKGKHSGWYSVSDECFYTEAQVQSFTDPKTNETYLVSQETGQRVEWTEEENYKFKLSAFRESLLKWLADNPKAIYPAKRHAEVIASISDPAGLQDLSISRSSDRLHWGIPVPGDEGHTMYVWLEALVNYLTVAGYPWVEEGGKGHEQGWPAAVQIVGKDIVRFHAIFWPAFLMAVGLEPPTSVVAHAHWTMGRQKMSKSRGNVASPFKAMDTFGVDAVRYYLARAGGNLVDDADWSAEQIGKHYRRDLQGLLGNLLSRLQAPKLLDKLPQMTSTTTTTATATSSHPFLLTDPPHPGDIDIRTMLLSLSQRVDQHLKEFEFGKALEAIMECVTTANRHFSLLEPWRASDTSAVCRAYFYSWQTLRITGILLQPFMPAKSEELLDRLGVQRDARMWDDAGRFELCKTERSEGGGGLFPRLEGVYKGTAKTMPQAEGAKV